MNNVSFVPAITTHYLVYKLCLQGFLYFLLCSLCTYTIAHAQDENQEYPEYLEEGRTFAIQNVSLVITYTTMAVAVVMMASFLWIALNFGTSRSGYSGYGSDDYYSRRKRSSGLFDDPDVLTNLLGSWHKYSNDEEDDLVNLVESEAKAKNSMFTVECAYQDVCTAGLAKNSENLRTLSLVLSLLQRAPHHLASLPTMANIMRAYSHGQTEGTCHIYKTETPCS